LGKDDEMKMENLYFFFEDGSGSGTVTRVVAVAGWQWYQSKVQVSAVRMVLDTRVAVATVKVLRQTHPQ
jgi:hypothetical protein